MRGIRAFVSLALCCCWIQGSDILIHFWSLLSKSVLLAKHANSIKIEDVNITHGFLLDILRLIWGKVFKSKIGFSKKLISTLLKLFCLLWELNLHIIVLAWKVIFILSRDVHVISNPIIEQYVFTPVEHNRY